MQLPVDLKRTAHKHGGRIIRITSIAHEVNKPNDGLSRDTWWFVGDVDWDDGTRSDGLEIAPWAVCCYDDDRSEVLALSELMANYLAERGEWCDRESKHEGWYANDRPKSRRRA